LTVIFAAAASDLKKAHIPDIHNPEGFLDVIMVGNLLEFSKAFAGKSTGNAEVEEQDVARFRYRRFMGWFADHHILVFDSHLVNPWYVFYRSLIEFGSSLCVYKSVWPELNTDGGFTEGPLRRCISEHIRDQWAILLPRFSQLLKSPTRLFKWTGPSFKIWRRDELPPNFVAPETIDHPDFPVLSANGDTHPRDADAQGEAMEAEGEGVGAGTQEEGDNTEEMDVEEGDDNEAMDVDDSGDQVDELEGDRDGPSDAGTANVEEALIASSVQSANPPSAPFTTLAAEERATKTDASSTADRACDGIAPVRPARSAHYTNLSGPSTTPTAKEPASTGELKVLVQLKQRLK
jgi:hypothetical protein